MIKQVIKWFMAPVMPLYVGGDGGDSQANTTSTTNTYTTSTNTDQSMMGGDNAVGLNGDGNIVDKSVVNNTAFTDSSNRSTNFFDASNRSTNFSDSSNRSTNFSDSSVKTSLVNDSSNHSTNYSSTTTDFGAVTAALSGMGKLSSQALDTSGLMVRDGLAAVSAQSKDNIAVLSKAFDFAGASSAADAHKYEDVLGFAREAISSTSAAYADAKDGGTNKTLTIAAVAVVGAVGLAAAMGKI